MSVVVHSVNRRGHDSARALREHPQTETRQSSRAPIDSGSRTRQAFLIFARQALQSSQQKVRRRRREIGNEWFA